MTHMCCFCGSPYHDTPNCKWKRAQDDAPIRYDIERMEKALKSPSYMMPSGLSKEEIVKYFDKAAKDLQ